MQEIANRNESLRIPFIPLKDSPLYVDCGSFVADAGKLVVVLQTKGDAGYYETVVSNTLQKSAMRRSGNQIILSPHYSRNTHGAEIPDRYHRMHPHYSAAEIFVVQTESSCGAAALYCP